ncbi:MAG: cupin domain-containing protein [Chitinophagales bacterium]|nr:cupin domain-containing protein [Chitinophagales bacterium]
MSVADLIESGIVELYCLGIASEEENLLVEQLAVDSPELKAEISAINEVLALYAVEGSKLKPSQKMKEKIIASLQTSDTPLPSSLPPVLTIQSTVDSWLAYLDSHNIEMPRTDFDLIMKELPGTADYFTYVVFANPGAVVSEEMHEGHEEYLLICKGECEMNIAGQTRQYKEGDFLHIAPGTRHTAVVTGTASMIVIGQRRAA